MHSCKIYYDTVQDMDHDFEELCNWTEQLNILYWNTSNGDPKDWKIRSSTDYASMCRTIWVKDKKLALMCAIKFNGELSENI